MAFSVVDESRKRRKESTQAGGSTLGSVPSSGSGFSVARESMRRRGLFENQDNDYSSWNNDTYNLSKRLQNEWEARKDQFQDKNQFKSYQNSVLQETGDLLRRAYASRDYYTQYGDQYSNRDQILKDINQNIDYLNDVRGGIVSEGQYWDQFENEDSYNAYKNMAAALADPVTDGIDSEELNNRLEEMKRRQSELKNQLSERENSGDMGGTTLLRREYDRTTNQLNALQKEYKDNFFGQFGASYTQGRLSQDEAQAWNDYLTLPTEENRKRAETLSAVLKQFQSQNEEVLKDDADLPLISQSLAGYLPQFLDQTKATISGGLVGFGAGSAVPVLGSLAGAKAGATAASGAYSYNTMRGSAFRDLLKLGVDEETARAAANDEAIVSAMIEMGDTLMDVSGLSYGVGSIIDVARKGLTKKFAKEGAEAVAESAAKKLLKGLGRYGLTVGGEAVEEGAQQAVSIANRERLKDGGSGIPDLAKRSVGTGWDALRGANPEARAEILEAAEEGGKIAALMGGLNAGFTAVGNRVLNTNTEHRQSVTPVEKVVEQVESPVLSEQRNSGINLRDNLEPTLIEDEMRKGNRQITGKLDTQPQTAETAAYNAFGQAERQETSNQESNQQVTDKLTDQSILQDDSLDSQIRQAEERAVQSAYKAGLAGMSEKAIPTDNPIELKAYTTGREERRRRIGEAERAGYGDMGTKAFMGVVEKTGAEPGRARLEFQSAYEQGLTNAPRENVVLRSEIQKEAYKAGLLDRAASMKHDTQVSIGTRHGKGGLIQNEYSAKLDTKLSSTLHKIGSATGTRIVMDGRLMGSDANGYYENGEIHLSPDAENPLMQVVKHELTHHLQELAPAEYRAFRDYAVQLESAGTWNIYGSSTATETMRERYLSASKGRVNLTTEGAMDEIAAHYAERILSDETTLANFINHVTQSESPQTRSMGQKFFESVRAFVDKVKRIFKGDTAQMDRAARDEFGTTVEQLERAEQLWKEAYRAAEKNAQISSDFVKDGAAASLEAAKNADQQDGEDERLYSLKKADFQEDKYFARQMDKWNELDDGSRVKVGIIREGSALNRVGLPTSGMYFDVGKIKKAMEKHNDHLTPTVLKQIPTLMNDPIIIAEYTGPGGTIKNTVNVYGNLFVGEKPVVVGVVMRLDRSGNGVVSHVRTIHARGNFAKQITDDTVLYLNEDKKKTRNWFQVCGNLNVPLEGTKFGLIRSISFDMDNVNDGEKRSRNITAGVPGANSLVAIQNSDSKANVTDFMGGVKKFSLKDSDNRTLTAEQAEYFKDSVVRDEDGNLLVMYHGTSNGGHTVFEPYGKAKYGLFGVGSYFTDSRDVAESYTNKGRGDNKQVYETYLNIKNPIDMDASADADAWRRAIPDADFPDSGSNEQFYRAMEDHFRDMEYARWEAAETAMEVIEGMGFDGITHIGGGRFNKNDDTRHRVYIAFEPEQIKSVDNIRPTSDADIRFSLKEQSNLLKENAKLREVNAALREQFKTTKFTKVDRKALDRLTKRLLKDYSSSTDFDTVRESLDQLYTYLANGEDQMPPSWQEAYQQAYETAVSILEAVQVQDDQLYQDYKALRDRLRTAGVTLREEYSHDLQGYESLSDFRKHYIGRLKITSDGLPVDVLYQELAEDYPEFFSPDVTHPADQLVLMGDVLDDLRPVIGNPYSHNMRESATWLANDIIERFFELPQAKPTFADKAARKLDAQKAASAQKLDAQKSESARKLDAQKEEAAQRLDRQQLADQMYHGRKMAEQQNKQAQQLEKNREKQRQRVQNLLEDNRARMELLRAEEQVRREKALDQLEEKYTRKLDRLTKRNHKAQAQNQKYRDSMKEGRERRKSKALRERIFRHTNQLSQKLLHPNDKQHIPENLRGTVLALLESINLESGYETVLGKDGLYHQVERGTDLGAEQTNKTHAFRALKKLYADLSQGGELVVDPSLLGGEGIQNAFDAVLEFAEIPIDNLNSAQLQTLWEVLRAVEHSINTAGKILSAAKFQRTQDWADALVSDTASRRKRKGSALEKWRLDLENPYTFFSHYGEAGKAIFRMLRDAQDHQQEMVSQLQKETEKIADSKTIREWDREIHTFTTERGQELKLTSAHCMELYLLSRREQAQDHLMKGGIVQPEIKHSRIYRGTEAVLLSEADLKAIAGLLTSAQVKAADALQRLTSTTLANFGNEASMKAYGYQKFTEENYWPIRSAAEGIHSSVEKGGNNPRSIKNIGLAKSVIPHANNPVDISGVFQTFSRHAGDMTDYAAWLCPMEDANRLFNYQFRDELGEKTGQTVKGLLDRVGGRGAKDYWFRLMEDIQNGIKMTSDTAVMGAVSKGIGNARGASVSWNIRVIVQQPTAILRAAAVLSPADMAVGLVTGGGWETALKYSAIARRKEMGGFDLSAPAQMRELLFDDQKNAVQRIDELGTLGAAKADALTWGRIWNACEQATKRQHGNLAVGSLAFYEETAKLFDEVIDQTQVVDGVLQRSQVMRSSDSVVNHATAFMGEPIMAMNLLIRSWDAFRGESDTKKRQMAMRTFGRAVAALVVTNAFNAFAQSLVDGIRDDDDEKYWERVQRAFWGVTGEEESTSEKMKNLVLEGNLAGNLNPVAQIPFLKDILSIISGYSVYRADAAVLEDIIQAGKDFTDSIRGEGKKTVLYALKNLTQQAGKILGISAPNMMRDIYGALRSIAVETGDVAAQYELEKWIYTMQNTGNKGRFVDLAYQAYVQKDMGLYTRIVQELMENGVEATYIENRMKSLAKKESGRSDSQQFPSVDVWGRPSSYVPKAEKGPVEQELLRLFVATGKGNVFPSKADQKFVIDEEEKILTAEEYTRYATVRGQTAYKLITDLISSKAYKQMSDKEKLDVVKIAYDYANQTAKAAVSKFEPDKWVEYMKSVRAECGISQGTFLALKSMVKGIEGLKDAWKVDEDGKPVTITNSEGLLIMEKVYDSKLVTGLTSDQLKILFEYLGVGKNVRHYSAALVRQKLGEMRKRSVG